MAINQPGIAISIKGFLPTGKTLDEQFAALTIVKTAHETGDYSSLLKAAHDVEIKTESKTRRVEEKPEAQPDPSADPDFVDLPETAPEGEPSLQDVSDYGADTAAAPEDWQAGETAPAEEQPAAEPAGRKRRAATE